MSILCQQATLLEHVGGETASSVRPQALPRETFEVFGISQSAIAMGSMRPFDIDANTMSDAIEAAAGRTPHKAHFAIRHTDTLSGRSMIHFYVVRQKSKGERRYHEYQTRVVHDRYAELLFVLDGAAVAAIGGGK